MYLFFVDESGNPDGWKDQDNFVLGGVAVFEGRVRRLTENLDKLQNTYFPGIHVPIEFHGSVIRGGKERFARMAKEDRDRLLTACYNVIAGAGFPSLVAFSTAIHISAVKDPDQALKDCLEDLCEKFNAFLVGAYKQGHNHKGLLILDKTGRENRIRQLISTFGEQGTRHGYLGNIVDVPYFADSHHTRMLQVADLVAYAVGRYENSNDRTYLDKILSRFYTSPSGQRIGFTHMIGRAHRCSCNAWHIFPHHDVQPQIPPTTPPVPQQLQ